MPTQQNTLATHIKRGDVMAAQCPSRVFLRHVTSQWGVLVLTALRTGTLRYSDIRRRIHGISEKMLAQTLRTLEADGFVQRTVHPAVPPHVDYHLTFAGEEVARRVADLANWIETHLTHLLSAQNRLNADAAC